MLQHLNALNGSVRVFKDPVKTRLFVLKVLEWTDEEKDSPADGMTSKIEEGRRMPSVVIFTIKGTFE